MSVILELSVPRASFTLGRILPDRDDVDYTLEAIVPLGERPVPFIRVHDGDGDRLVEEVTAHPAVSDMSLQTLGTDEQIYSLDWDSESDGFLTAVRECNGHLLSAGGFQGDWQFRLVFPDHESASAFDAELEELGIENGVITVSNPWVPDRGLGDRLTSAQREALELALRTGYYDIPRRGSTSDIADELGISDQAVSERLRRGIATLIEDAMTHG